MVSNQNISKILNFFKSRNQAAVQDIVRVLQLSNASVRESLKILEQKGKVSRSGDLYHLTIDHSARVTKTTSPDPPLFSFAITNPVTYLKRWWAKILGNDGMDVNFKFTVHPLTAIGIAVVIASSSFGLGQLVSRLAMQNPVIGQYVVEQTSQDAALVGALHYSQGSKTFYLITPNSEAVRLVLTSNFQPLETLIGRSVLVEGRWSLGEHRLQVVNVEKLD